MYGKLWALLAARRGESKRHHLQSSLLAASVDLVHLVMAEPALEMGSSQGDPSGATVTFQGAAGGRDSVVPAVGTPALPPKVSSKRGRSHRWSPSHRAGRRPGADQAQESGEEGPAACRD